MEKIPNMQCGNIAELIAKAAIALDLKVARMCATDQTFSVEGLAKPTGPIVVYCHKPSSSCPNHECVLFGEEQRADGIRLHDLEVYQSVPTQNPQFLS